MQAESRQLSKQHTQRANNKQSALTYVILNPRARGGRNAKLATQLQKILSQCGLEDALINTDSPQAALQRFMLCHRVVVFWWRVATVPSNISYQHS